MISKEAKELKSNIEKDVPGKDLLETRHEWESYASTLTYSNRSTVDEELIEGIKCVWINKNTFDSGKIIFYVHGGGLVSGSSETHKEFSVRLSETTNSSVILINYSLAPESKYPKAINELIDVYKKIIKRVDSKSIIFAGDSSGAGLALATLLLLKDRNIELPLKFISISGSFDNKFLGDSFKTRETVDPFTSKDVLIECFQMYTSIDNVANPYVSPIYGDLCNLPPMLIIVGDHEILLSDSVMLDEKVKGAGGNSKLVIFDEMWHVWPLYGDFKESEDALNLIKEFI